MQKLILGFLLSLGLIVSSFANEIDLISLATNGAYNEQSKGVKVLNDEEMSEVVGGATLFDNNGHGNLIYHYGAVNNSGAKIYYTAYYRLYESYNNELLPLNVDDGSRRYIPVVAATLNHLTNQVSVSIIGVNGFNPIYTRPADRYYAYKLLENRRVINEVNNVIRNHSRYFWGNR